jgi:hypothetical protein
MKRGTAFRCPFCRIQLDGIDPFRELTSWVETIDRELRVIHRLVSEASSRENQLMNCGSAMPMNEFQMRTSRTNLAQNRSNLNRTLQEIHQRVMVLTNL